jgi:hypothetical protein
MSLERLFKGTISIVLSQIYADTDADFPTPDLYSFNHKITQPSDSPPTIRFLEDSRGEPFEGTSGART